MTKSEKSKKPTLKRRVRQFAKDITSPTINQSFFQHLIRKTSNFSNVTWLGKPVWQNVLDLWIIQEVIWEVKPQLLIECGTNRGGSAIFYAQLFDLVGNGKVITIDIEKMHELEHPRVEFIIGSSTSVETIEHVRTRVAETEGPIMVILDSDHSEQHVATELESYAHFVTLGSYLLVQDGVIDVLPIFRKGRPGPLPAIEKFLKGHPEFESDIQRNEKFTITQHPKGWLRKTR